MTHYYFLLTVFIGLLCSCKPRVSTSQVSYVIGNNDIDLLGTNNNNVVPDDVIESVVLIATTYSTTTGRKVKFGSGTLISGNRIISNHHVFAQAGEDGKASEELVKEACTDTRVYFEYNNITGEASDIVGCKAGTLKTDYLGDLAVFELSRTPRHNPKPLQISEQDTPNLQEELFVIHHPDVESNYSYNNELKAGLPLASITTKDCRIIEPFPNIQWEDPTLNVSWKHSCDLLEGSSGSALVSKSTGKIVGVNWGGVKLTNNGNKETVNAATSPGYLLAFLTQNQEQYFATNVTNQESYINQSQKAGSDANIESEDSGCGVIGGKHQHASRFIAFLLFFLPIFIVSYKIKVDVS